MTLPPTETRDQRNRLRQLFGFLHEMQLLRNPPIAVIDRQPWHYWLRDLPVHPSITLETDTLDDEEGEGEVDDANGVFLRITRPTLTQPPRPPLALHGWLAHGWDDCEQDVTTLAERPVRRSDGSIFVERFDENPDRVAALGEWSKQRDAWAELERPARWAVRLFEQVYELWGMLQREGERIEFVLGDGILSWDRPDRRLFHPILLQSLQLLFDPAVPAFSFVEAERPPELYSALFRGCEEIDGGMLAEVRKELEQGGFQPLAEDTTAFFRGLIQRLSSRGQLVSFDTLAERAENIRIARSPVIFLRQRTLGYVDMIQRILDDIPTRDDLPASLLRVCGFDTGSAADDESIGSRDRPHSVRHEDVLFSKPANEEQLQIAHRLVVGESSVLVQGPPGTGKTHTIANLVGHLLAQGKSVLVTSHTTKALRVLREKVAEPLRPLCVSVLDSDLESRGQLQAAVTEISRRLTSGDAAQFEREAERLASERSTYLQRLDVARDRMRRARQGEYREVVVAGTSYTPSQAARIVCEGRGVHAWLPGPLLAAASLPLTAMEAAELYRTNEELTPGDERELGLPLPQPEKLTTPNRFWALARERGELLAQERAVMPELWTRSPDEQNAAALSALLADVGSAVTMLAAEDWRVSAVNDGRRGGTFRNTWEELIRIIDETTDLTASCRTAMIEYAPAISADIPLEQQDESLSGLIAHLERGGNLPGRFFGNKEWKHLIEQSSVQGNRPSKLEHFQALRAQVRLNRSRERLRSWWDRLMAAQGAPSASSLGDEPELAAAQYVPLLQDALSWHTSVWEPVEQRLLTEGFHWQRLIESVSPDPSSHGDLRRLRRAAVEYAPAVFQSRIAALRLLAIEREFRSLAEALSQYAVGSNRGAEVVERLRAAVEQRDGGTYREAYERLVILTHLRTVLDRRRNLLHQVEAVAPSWSAAINGRIGPHGVPQPPGDVSAAWLWRQLDEELTRRATESIEDIQREIAALRADIERTTATLAEQRAWAAQARRTSLQQHQALSGWQLAIRKKAGGRGKRAPILQAEARRLMSECRSAVPVWIMPLSRVAENFDPRSARFDVVIIDEASQSDVTALIAFYLGRQVLVVGDDEQVTPDAVGQNLAPVQQLIDAYLRDIPNGQLYDGQISVYHLAQQSASGTTMLLEHFRCAPDIIAFSNHLSYNGMVRPLRDPSSINLYPNVVEYRIEGRRGDGKTNEEEAETVVALIAAAHEHPAYAGKTFGVISLLGEEQARLIETKLRARLPLDVLEGRRIVCGTPPQFQGDERHVMFLTMVDSPADGPLFLRAGDSLKRRYNVAASRAQDQMWLIHSLDPGLDLKAGDLRRRLIEHVRDPKAVERAVEQAEAKAESEFERRVLRHLIESGYHVTPQFKVGSYRIDLVVEGEMAEGKRKHLAVECDGDRFHPIEKLDQDMERQAVLERLGWIFMRVRGSEFFRDEEKAMAAVYRRLDELGIHPAGFNPASTTESDSGVRDEIVRRAEAIRRSWSESESEEAQDERAAGSVPLTEDDKTARQAVSTPVSVVSSSTLEHRPSSVPGLDQGAVGSASTQQQTLWPPQRDGDAKRSHVIVAPAESHERELGMDNAALKLSERSAEVPQSKRRTGRSVPIQPVPMRGGPSATNPATPEAIRAALEVCLPERGEMEHSRLLRTVARHLGVPLSAPGIRQAINSVLEAERRAGNIGTDRLWQKHWRVQETKAD